MELQAHCRAHAVQEQADQQARQVRRQTEQWLRQVQQEYEQLRSQVESTVSHAADVRTFFGILQLAFRISSQKRIR